MLSILIPPIILYMFVNFSLNNLTTRIARNITIKNSQRALIRNTKHVRIFINRPGPDAQNYLRLR